jgi:Beta-fructosidases (levanase/invertase)
MNDALRTERPLIHYTPARNWMNDPNGLIFHNGRYHLFYQYNPEGAEHAHMSWGHASSTDLIGWEEHPLAIPFDENEEVYSGSIVLDSTNSSGFGVDGSAPLVAVYTSAGGYHEVQAQALAFSLDDGMTWTKYDGNPVLDRESLEFRDPKVFRYGTGDSAHWVMVAVEATQRQVLLYRSDDLKEWTYLSSYGPAGATAGVWECPDLFPLAVDGDPDDVRWVLVISLSHGAIAGGSGSQYVVGSFDGVTFTPDTPLESVGEGDPALDRLGWVDAGHDCYAGVTFNGLPDGERLFIAWMSNWDYARHVPTSPWRGAMTLPRRLSLVTSGEVPQLRAEPVTAPGEVVADRSAITVTDTVRVGGVAAAARVDIEALVPAASELTIRLRHDDSGGGGLALRYSGATRRLELDRSGVAADIHGSFTGAESVVLPDGAGRLDLSIILDVGSIEVFAAGGLRGLTDLVFEDFARDDLLVEVAGEPVTIERIRITDLTGGRG